MAARNSQILRTIPFILIVVLLCPFAYGRIIYVDDDAIGGNIGSNWLDAINSLQDALLLAYFYEKPVEIRVAKGVYTPDQGIGIMPGDREASFQLINGVTIKGGYAGLSDRPTDARDIVLYETILSGDLEHNDGPDHTNTSENSFHVVTSYRTDYTPVLDGITITAGGNTSGSGRDDDSEDNMGGGMYNNYGNPMLINCTFNGNRGRSGAAVFNSSGSPSFVDCTFSGNLADNNGGGMYNDSCAPRLLNCTFVGNSANSDGGGMYNNNSDPAMTNCTFSENSGHYGGSLCNYISEPMLADCHFIGNWASQSGGAVYNNGSISTFFNCTFEENSASVNGGGIFNEGSTTSSQMSLTNCIFIRNSARYGGALVGGGSRMIMGTNFDNISTINNNPGIMSLFNCTFNGNSAEFSGGGISVTVLSDILFSNQINALTMVNCILWGDTPDEIHESGGEFPAGNMSESVVILYSNVQGGFPGQGNVDMDPLFADPNNDDYHLKSQAGRWNATSQSWVIDQISSPCIDAGDPNIPVGLERFPNGDIINMGAYGGTPQASLSPLQLPLLYSKAYNPYPPDGASGVDDNVTLSWMAGINAVFHDVYFGIDSDNVTVFDADTSDTTGIYRGRQTATSYTPPESAEWSNRTYYWRIDEVDSEGKIVTGDVWTFNTNFAPPKGRACFIGQTGVWSNGNLVPISKVASGRSINVIECIKTVEEVQEHKGTFALYDILLESGASVTVAENHYFMTESEQWVSLQNLMTDQILPSGRTRLKTSKGTVGITSITKRPMPYVGKVYNLKIQGSDRYLVGKDAIIVRDY